MDEIIGKAIVPPFAADYLAARIRFRSAATKAGFELQVFPIGLKGPHGEDLTIDFAVKADAQPKRVAIISSGTHGIEGFFGSAVQTASLEIDLGTGWRYPAGTSVVFVHAVNPYGFAYLRRVNEQNVDLNRNFIKSSYTYSGAPDDYARLDNLLNPASEPTILDTFIAQAGLQIIRYGFKALKNAIAQGQYEFPQGLFFGGKGPSKSLSILAEVLPPLVRGASRVVHLDLHTGMGRRGTYKLVVDLPSDSSRVERLRREFGANVVQGFDPNGVLYEINGSLGGWLQDLFPDIDYDCMLAEYGTRHVFEVLTALREENRAYHYAKQDGPVYQKAKRRLKEAFCPNSRAWQAKSVRDGRRLVMQAIATLSG